MSGQYDIQKIYEMNIADSLTGDLISDLNILYKERNTLEVLLNDIEARDAKESLKDIVRDFSQGFKPPGKTGDERNASDDEEWEDYLKTVAESNHQRCYGEPQKETFTKRLAFINGFLKTIKVGDRKIQ